ncbi:MAG: type II secretion system F family protein [Gammaproteobacteria bacterium]|nr:type II secretion system F family protein [Gammaproteobacteria bacterium]
MVATFTYQVRDEQGHLHSGELEAGSSGAAAKALRERGYTPLSLEEKKQSALQKEITIPGLGGHIKAKEVAVFSRQFATMINAGLSLLRSLDILAEQTPNKVFAQAIRDVKTDVEKGRSLSEAMQRHPKAFNRLYVAMVRAGEIGGVLDTTLLRLADSLERQVEMRGKIKSAMTYPVAVLGLVVLILTAMLIFVVPMFESMYADLGGTLPLPTRILLGVSGFTVSNWYIIFGITLIGAYGFRRWVSSEQGRFLFDQIKLRLPIFGELTRKSSIARFSETLASLTRTAVPILQAMDIVADTAGNAVVAKAIRDVQASVKEGESLAGPLSEHPIFPPMVVQMLAVGEETGALDTMLDKLGEFYNAEVNATVDSLTSLLEPLLMVVLGGSVGTMIIALYMPMFNLINLVQ